MWSFREILFDCGHLLLLMGKSHKLDSCEFLWKQNVACARVIFFANVKSDFFT